MRTIEEVKADIERYNRGDTLLSYKKLLREYVCAITGSITLGRLEEICNAERDGRYVVLTGEPMRLEEFRIGMTLWGIMSVLNQKAKGLKYKPAVVRCEVKEHYKDDLGEWIICEAFGYGLHDFKLSAFGKTVFLTREEAEAALSKSEVSQ